MQYQIPFSKLSAAAILFIAIGTQAKPSCPTAITTSAESAYPGSKVSSCKKEKEDGKIQYQVDLKTKDSRKLDIDMDTTGTILLTEEIVPNDSVSQEAQTAFAAKYPKSKITKAERQTKADGAVTYELSFKEKGKKKEATFQQNGTFVEIE